jgi:hypothetical protein
MSHAQNATQIDISRLRQRLGRGKPITQAALARLLGGVSQSTVSRLEKGAMKPAGPVALLLKQLDSHAPPVPPEGAHQKDFPPEGAHRKDFPPEGAHRKDFPPEGAHRKDFKDSAP